MGDPFDPDRLRLNAPLPAPVKRPRPTAGGKCLKGPIPMGWVEAALVLPGGALAVGVFLCFEAGCVRGDAMDMTYARLARRGLAQSTARRGLRRLEAA